MDNSRQDVQGGSNNRTSSSAVVASPTSTSTDLDRKVLRDNLYAEIFQRHRRSIFAFGSFLRMLKTKKSNYNVIKQETESD
ncbi:PREDICTED: uncharacterized protein LOC108561187 [Nicrophorus vespilloides]|uniref:Uncharacterized protein LOC108561187 n=1 Tax=Nicrophorus vespilloides TaxID=110193 RepID=A0ABM1MIW0_NICVS|nr:PREDICTED: uncharacterized protein LOC108561187 [Nicrophorus vespilloides]